MWRAFSPSIGEGTLSTDSMLSSALCTEWFVLSHSVVSDSLPPHGL